MVEAIDAIPPHWNLLTCVSDSHDDFFEFLQWAGERWSRIDLDVHVMPKALTWKAFDHSVSCEFYCDRDVEDVRQMMRRAMREEQMWIGRMVDTLAKMTR